MTPEGSPSDATSKQIVSTSQNAQSDDGNTTNNYRPREKPIAKQYRVRTEIGPKESN